MTGFITVVLTFAYYAALLVFTAVWFVDKIVDDEDAGIRPHDGGCLWDHGTAKIRHLFGKDGAGS